MSKVVFIWFQFDIRKNNSNNTSTQIGCVNNWHRNWILLSLFIVMWIFLLRYQYEYCYVWTIWYIMLQWYVYEELISIIIHRLLVLLILLEKESKDEKKTNNWVLVTNMFSCIKRMCSNMKVYTKNVCALIPETLMYTLTSRCFCADNNSHVTKRVLETVQEFVIVTSWKVIWWFSYLKILSF